MKTAGTPFLSLEDDVSILFLDLFKVILDLW